MPMDSVPIFSRKLLLAFVAFAIGAFALSLYLMGREDYGADSIGPSSYSTSALGYAGIFEVLEQLGVPVRKSRRNPTVQAEGGVLIVAEPQLNLLPQIVVPVLPDAQKTLLILPKWVGVPQREKKSWISRAIRVLAAQVERTLSVVVDRPDIQRREKIEGWTVNEVGPVPELSEHVQLIKSDVLRPLVAAGDGILLGELRKDGKLIWVLSDPDVIANHAFSAEGKGVAFAVAMVQKLRGDTGPVVFDETAHGFHSPPAKALSLLFEFPYLIITLQVVIGAALLLWATMGRFGPPETAPPPLSTGKAGLIDNVADLMEFAGHERLIIQRYVENTIRDTARRLRAPKELSFQQLLDWLAKLGAKRNVTSDCAAIVRRAQDLTQRKGAIDISKFAEAAREINQWKREIVDGLGAHTRHH